MTWFQNDFENIISSLMSIDQRLIHTALDQLSVEIDDIEVCNDLPRLKTAFLSAYDSVEDVSLKSTIIWLCGKFHDSELKPFFVRALKESLGCNDKALLWSAIIALDNLNEVILPTRGGSFLDVETNRAFAENT